MCGCKNYKRFGHIYSRSSLLRHSPAAIHNHCTNEARNGARRSFSYSVGKPARARRIGLTFASEISAFRSTEPWIPFLRLRIGSRGLAGAGLLQSFLPPPPPLPL